MLEVPDPFPDVTVVGYADESPDDEFVDTGLFAHFPHGRDFYVFSLLLMALGEIPQAVPAYQKEIPPPVGHEPSGGVDFLELGAYPSVHPVRVFGGNVDFPEGGAGFEHGNDLMYAEVLPRVVLYGVGIGKGCFPLRTDDDASVFEVYPVDV